MKLAKYSKIALIAMLSVGITQGTSFAKQKKDIDEDSSVHNWGPWGKMVTPAAGPTPTLAVQLPTGFVYQPTPTPTPTPTPDGPAQFRSYATYSRYTGSYTYYNGRYTGGESNRYYRVPAGMQLDVTYGPLDEDEGDITAASFRVGPWVANANFPNRQSVPMEGGYWLETDDGYIYTYGEADGYAEDGDSQQWSNVYFVKPPWQGDITVGHWDDGNDSYVSADGGEGYTYSYEGGEGAFVQGMTPTIATMEALAAGNVVGTYEGRTLNWVQMPVEITMNFGSATWSGSWNGGVDPGSNPHTHTDGAGVNYICQGAGFNANGTITGVDFASTSLTAGDLGKTGSISGAVNGSIFGANAEAVGGIVDITKTTDNYENGKYVDVFYADKLGGVDGGEY